MKLREKIVNKAIELFNEKGIATVSPNQIAAALDISTGNLTYYFKTKASLLKEIYEQMDEVSKDFIHLEGYLTLDDFRKIMSNFRDFMQAHSFFFQDLVFILRNYAEVGTLYKARNLVRLKQGRQLFDYYIQTGRMLPENEGLNYDFLTHNVWMVGAFWNTQSKIFEAETIFGKPMDLVDMTWYMLLPYLTPKGREEYEQINAIVIK
jgi:AcrR family transcriptional regulator